MFNKIFKLNKEAFSHKLFQVIFTFILVDFAWIFFRANRFLDGLRIVKSMLTVHNWWILVDDSLFSLGLDWKNFMVMIGAIIILLIVKYHTRWTSLTYSDFIDSYSISKGAEPRIRVETAAYNYTGVSADITDDLEYTTGMEYIEKIIQFAQENNIQVLLTLVPYPDVGEITQQYYNYAYRLAEKYNIQYLDIRAAEIINYTTDRYDVNSHLNPSGAYKVTNYIGQYLSNEYDLTDHRGDLNYSYWDSDYETWIQARISELNNQTSINEYLMLLTNDEFQCRISVSNRVTQKEIPLVYSLINNIHEIEVYTSLDENSIIYSNIPNVDSLTIPFESESDISIDVYRVSSGELISTAQFNFSDLTLVKKQ